MNSSRSTNSSSDKQRPAGEKLSEGLSNFTSDLSSLVDLQIELLKVELRQWLAQIAGSAALIGAGVVLALAATPVLLTSLALWLRDASQLSLAQALAAVGGGGIAVAGLLVAIAVTRLQRGAAPLPRFRTELSNNIRWIGQIVGRRRPTPTPAPAPQR